MLYVLLAVCGILGVFVRFFVTNFYSGMLFPWGTLIVNVLGSFFMGAYYGHQLLGHPWFPPVFHTAVTVGLLGALTTYSTFSLDTVKLLHAGEIWIAGLNVFTNTFLSLLFCFLGIKSISLIS